MFMETLGGGVACMSQEVFSPHMLRDARLFTGRWYEIQQLTDALQRHVPVAVVGAPGSGKSSLLYHVATAAPVLFDRTDMVSHYIDLAAFADIGQVRRALAQAFGQSESQWLTHLPALDHTPLLVFDNVDVTPCAAELDQWWQELAGAIQRGHVYCAQATSVPPSHPMWHMVTMRAVTATQIQDMVEAALGEDAPRISRADQDWILRESAGNMGHVVALLAVWHAHAGSADWQAAARAQVRSAQTGRVADPDSDVVVAAAVQPNLRAQRTDDGDGVARRGHADDDTPVHTTAWPAIVSGQGLWWVALLAGIMALVWWLW